MSRPPISLDATGLAEYVRLQSCERWLWYRLHPKATAELLERHGLQTRPISPMLRARGREHENAVIEGLRAAGHEVVDLTGQPAAETRAMLHAARQRVLHLAQARIEGRIGGVPAVGIADLLRVGPEGEGVALHVMDMKASREDKVEHRIQVAFYTLLLRQILEEEGIPLTEASGAILRPQEPTPLDPAGDKPPPYEDKESGSGVGPVQETSFQAVPFDVVAYEETLRLMVEPPAGVIVRLAGQPRETAAIHLGYRCDGCSMSALCFREAAATADLTLVPFLSLPEKKALRREGIATLTDLAALKEPSEDGTRLVPAGGHEERVARLASLWPVGAALDLHVQRARAAARRRGGSETAFPMILDAPPGLLPSRQTYPGLVQVFLDAQHDYASDRLYMLAALIVGPGGTVPLVEMAAERPGASGPEADRAEGDLVVKFTVEVLSALPRAAGADAAPVHFYVYDRHDQRRLLEGMRRHLGRLESIPAFFDLLTESPALTQAMVTFLAAEVRERLNLGQQSHALPVIASALGFRWELGGLRLDTLFRTGIFDGFVPGARGVEEEVDARFGSQIPLEYAYAAWGCLPEGPGLIADALRTAPPSREDLRVLAEARTRAMAHIEEALPRKNVTLEKVPLPLARLRTTAPVDRPPRLAGLLVEFLFLEHHARLQELLQLYAMPVERRVQSGASLLLRGLDRAFSGTARLRTDFRGAGVDPRVGLLAMSLKEGDWVVLNEPGVTQPWDVLRGRLCRVKAMGASEVTLELMDMSFPSSRLRYAHRRTQQVEPGKSYVIDPMADDFVAERLLDACRNTAANDFLALVEQGAGAATPRPVAPTTSSAIEELLTVLSGSPAGLPLTARQREIIAERLAERVLLVQGPPGTGKTHTVAWAILARLWVAASAKKRMRVLVTAATHTAVDVLLGAVAALRGHLSAALAAAGRTDPLATLRISKESSDPGAVTPDGVRGFGRGGVSAELAAPLVAVGAVPGGIHRIQKELGGGQVDWARKLWDLLVIDEASQVGLPAAVLAGSALKQSGQAIVVGDHRQMSPILVHEWLDEQRRGVQEARVYASTFELLRDRGFPLVRLDRSFRLHRDHADFLERHIYREDGVGFHSHRTETLPALPSGGASPGFVAAALDPAYPVVIVEHREQGSLKQNALELTIVRHLIEALADVLHMDPRTGVGVVVPFRAQRAALQAAHPELARAGAIDTVERFQGGERDVIIVSATASDPDYVLAESDFLLNPNRFNVAISRPRQKLILVASQTLFHLTPPDVALFEAALLWKRLRAEFSREELWVGEVDGTPVRVLGRKAGAG